MKMLLSRIIPAFLIFSQMIACGFQEEHDCNFRMSIETDKPEIKTYYVDYLGKLNQKLGFEAFTFVSNSSDANSPLKIEKGLKERTKRERGQEFIGLGGFYPDYNQSNNLFELITDGHLTTEVQNQMKLHFDEDFVLENLKNNIEKLETASAHEFGHGLGLGHVEKQTDVMYYEVSGDKDFDAHYANMGTFFSDRNCVADLKVI